MPAQDALDVGRRVVPDLDPHDLGGWPVDDTVLMEVGVLGDDRQAVSGGVSPDQRIARIRPDPGSQSASIATNRSDRFWSNCSFTREF
jgi:hypothetical protein